jgi:thiol-disulfide isomerase/thioredoxin
MKRYFQLLIMLLVPLFGFIYLFSFQSFYSNKVWTVPFQVIRAPTLEVVPLDEFKSSILKTTSTVNMDHPITVVHFWASWCPPCVEEFPALVELQRRLAGVGVRFVFVSVDEKPENALGFLKKIGASLSPDSLFWDSHKLMADKWGSTKFPETYVVSSSGWVIEKIIGLQQWLRPSVENYFRDLSVKYTNRVDGVIRKD